MGNLTISQRVSCVRVDERMTRKDSIITTNIDRQKETFGLNFIVPDGVNAVKGQICFTEPHQAKRRRL